MEERRPELYFSTLTGIVMMFFILTALTNKELFHYDLNLFGFSLSVGLESTELLIFLAAVFTNLGMYQALRLYLPDEVDQVALHLFLPFAVTLTIGFTLRSFGSSDNGWMLLLVTAVLLYLVMYFEYVSCDPASVFRPLSIIVLDSLCYAVFLLFMIALRANISRLVLSLPAAFILCLIVSLKIYSFHIIGSSVPLLSFVTGMVIVFAETGLHYMPINIVSYGTLTFLWYYTVTSFFISSDRNESFRLLRRRLLPAWLLALIVLVYSVVGL
ncbi:MAG: hypothetical protein IJI57_08185 [Flexilinea sp.]|nr:hypothetical protein [Flexilinea sp.]